MNKTLKQTKMGSNQKFTFTLVAICLVTVLLTAAKVFADGPAPGGAGAPAGMPPQPSLFGMVMPFIAMFGIFYFLMIRPQQKKMKAQKDMMSTLQNGDDVLMTSGLIGKVAGLTDKVVTLEVADNVKVKMLKSQVAQVIKGQIADLQQ